MNNGFKTLIFVPHFFKPGGVGLFFKSIRPFLGSNYRYFHRGNKSVTNEKLAGIHYMQDYFRLVWLLLTQKNDFFVINTSLAKSGCNRDAIFIWLLSVFRKRFMVFFHGWNKAYAAGIDQSGGFDSYPLNKFKDAEAIVVLAKEFREKLFEWGFSQPVFLGRTVVDQSLIADYIFDAKRFNQGGPFNFLFLARVEQGKGIFEAVEIFAKIQALNPNLTFNFDVGGDGSFLGKLKEYVSLNNIKNVNFLGHVEGNEKRKALENAHFFLFPSHSEGMPLSVLEAMAFGIPCLVTPVGGLKDFFLPGEMGVLLDSPKNIDEAVEMVQNLITKPDELKRIARFNHEFAMENFLAPKVACELDGLISRVFKGNTEDTLPKSPRS